MKTEPILKVDQSDVYVEVTDDQNEYHIEDFVNISAYDSLGKDISNRVLYDSSHVDYTTPGDYIVTVSVMDDNMNMNVAIFKVHVLTEKDVRRLERGKPLKSEKQKEDDANHREKYINTAFSVAIVIVALGFAIYSWIDMFM